MTYQEDCRLSDGILEAITAGGLETLPELIRILFGSMPSIWLRAYYART